MYKTNTINEAKRLREITFAIAKLEEQKVIGSKGEKSNIAAAISEKLTI